MEKMTKEKVDKLLWRAEYYRLLSNEVLSEKPCLLGKAMKAQADAEAALFIAKLAYRDLLEGK